MPWSIFSDGGGKGAAVTWARDLLKALGAPETPGNQQFVYDWEVSEGGGGKYNPLNQGPVPGHPELTSTGPQFGGGAADFVSWSAGLQGAVDYLAMGNFHAIADHLRANDPAGARSALIASPWASSHYGGGSAFSGAALPGQASALPGGPAGGVPSGGTTLPIAQDASLPVVPALGGFLGTLFGDPAAAAQATPSDPLGLGALTRTLQTAALAVPVIIAGAGLVVLGLARMTNARQHVQNAAGNAAKVGEVAALA